MKFYISADLEGTAGVSNWNETEKGMEVYNPIALQMSKEVAAVAKGLIKGGGESITVKDAHDSAANILFTELPEETMLLKEWIGCPLSMIGGLDSSYSGVFFTGYHCGVHSDQNPLAHTMSRSILSFKLNGKNVSEFHLNAYGAISRGIPVIGITGDEEICKEAKEFNPNIVTVSTLKGIGKSSISKHPLKVLKEMEIASENAAKLLKNSPEFFKIDIPKDFLLEIEFLDHHKALRASFYPGAEKTGPRSIKFFGKTIEEVMTAYMFMS